MSAPTAPMADSVEFNPYSETFFNNPYDTYRRLRDEAPLYHNAEYGFWAISRYEDIAPAYKDSATFSSAKGVTLDMIKIAELLKGIPPQLIMLDPPEHDRMRRLVSKAFTPRAVKSWADLVTETIHGFFDDIADHPRRFLEGLARIELQQPHGPQQAAVNRLQPVAQIGQAARGDRREGIDQIAFGQRAVEGRIDD